MTIVSNKIKSISFRLYDDITMIENKKYNIKLPEVACNDIKDARYIQAKVNEFICKLSSELVCNKE